MADAPPFDRALLREFALCFVDAAVTRLLEESEKGDNSMTQREIPASCTNPGPALLTALDRKVPETPVADTCRSAAPNPVQVP